MKRLLLVLGLLLTIKLGYAVTINNTSGCTVVVTIYAYDATCSDATVLSTSYFVAPGTITVTPPPGYCEAQFSVYAFLPPIPSDACNDPLIVQSPFCCPLTSTFPATDATTTSCCGTLTVDASIFGVLNIS